MVEVGNFLVDGLFYNRNKSFVALIHVFCCHLSLQDTWGVDIFLVHDAISVMPINCIIIM